VLTNALQFWIKKTQQAHFEKELRALQRGAGLPRGSPLVRLSPFLDSNGLLRLGGRLERSTFHEEKEHPFILPRESNLSSLLIDQAHRRTLHGGTQLTLSVLRERVWIMRGRGPVKSFMYSPSRSYATAKNGTTSGCAYHPCSPIPQFGRRLCRSIRTQDLEGTKLKDLLGICGLIRVLCNISSPPGADDRLYHKWIPRSVSSLHRSAGPMCKTEQ